MGNLISVTEREIERHVAQQSMLQGAQGVLALFFVVLSGFLNTMLPTQFQEYIAKHTWIRYLVTFLVVTFSVVQFTNIRSMKHALQESIIIFLLFLLVLRFHPIVTLVVFFTFCVIATALPTDFAIVAKYAFPILFVVMVFGFFHWIFYWHHQSKQLDQAKSDAKKTNVFKTSSKPNKKISASSSSSSASRSLSRSLSRSRSRSRQVSRAVAATSP